METFEAYVQRVKMSPRFELAAVLQTGISGSKVITLACVFNRVPVLVLCRPEILLRETNHLLGRLTTARMVVGLASPQRTLARPRNPL